MPLTLLGIGEKGKIVRLTGPPAIRQYLSELGFVFGKTVEMVQQAFGNGLIVGLDGTRIALDRKMAHHIHIASNREGCGCRHKL